MLGGDGICRSMKKLPKTLKLKDNPVLQCGNDYKENVLRPLLHSNHAAQVSEYYDKQEFTYCVFRCYPFATHTSFSRFNVHFVCLCRNMTLLHVSQFNHAVSLLTHE